MEKARLFKNIIVDVVRLSFVVLALLISETKVSHIKTFMLAGLSLFLVIGAFLIQDMFVSLWKIPIALVMLLGANAIFQQFIKKQ